MEVTGIWSNSETPDLTVPGTLVYGFDVGISLRTTGTPFLERHSKRHSIQFINGILNSGQSVTLINCFVNQHQGSLVGTENFEFLADELVFGGFTSMAEVNKIHEAMFHFAGMEDWFDLRPIALTHNIETHEAQFQYKMPSDKVFTLDQNTTLVIRSSYTTQMAESVNQIKFRTKVLLILKSLLPLDVEHIISLTARFRMFFTLCAAKPFYIDELSVSYGLDEEGQAVWQKMVFHQSRKAEPNSEDDTFSRIKFMISYPQIQDSFGTVIREWTSKYEILSPIVESFFVYFYLEDVTAEIRFVNIVQAIESFHRRFRSIQDQRNESYDTKIKSILDSVDEAYRSWLQDKLRFAFEPSLKQRLDELFTEAYSFGFTGIFKDHEKAITKIKNTRNYLVHFDKSLEKKKMGFQEMWDCIDKLSFLLIFLILHDCGLEDSKLIELVTRTHFMKLRSVFLE